MSSSLLNVITYYQSSIEKNGHDEKRLLHCIDKLYKLPVKLEHLQSTGVGKTVNALRKFDKEVGVAAKALVAKWKAMVAAEAQVEEEVDDEEAQPDEYKDDNDSTDKSPRNNTQVDGENNNSSDDQKNYQHHVKAEHSSSSSKDKNQCMREGSSRRKSHEHRSRSVGKHKHSEKSNKSSRREESSRKRKKQDERDKSSSREYEGVNEQNVKSSSKISIVAEIEQDFEVFEDDDEEKLIIDDVSKEKTEEVDKNSHCESQNLSKNRHHSSKDKRTDASRREEENWSKEKSSKEHSRSKDIYRKEHKHSKEHMKKESNSSKDSLEKDNINLGKDSSKREYANKDNTGGSGSSSSRHSKIREKEKSSMKKNRSEDDNMSDEHEKSKHKEGKEKERKKREEKHSSSSHRSNGEHHTSKHKHQALENDKSTDQSSKDLKRKNSDSDSKSIENSPTKVKVPKLLVDGIDSSMGTSFEEALGMISASSSTKSTSKSAKTSPKMTATSSSSGNTSAGFIKPRSPTRTKTPPLLTSAAKLEPLDPSIALELPTISPNYKPLPLNPTVMECVFSSNKPQRRYLTDDEAMSAGISSKTIRTKVYSGVKSGALLQVPTLFDLCIRVLQKNIDALEYTGGVPFEVLKPVLERATPQQLITFEEFNPYLMEDSDVLWKQHCMRHCRGQKRQELETWREMFLRCKEEQERKLNMLAENIKQSQMQTQLPVRKTQLAYVDTMVKPPRNVQRKQEQYGTKSSSSATPAARVAALSFITPNASKAGDYRLKAAASAPDTVQIAVAASSANNGRPKKAPLMQKTIKFMKGRFRR